jgi:hypothetical protein
MKISKAKPTSNPAFPSISQPPLFFVPIDHAELQRIPFAAAPRTQRNAAHSSPARSILYTAQMKSSACNDSPDALLATTEAPLLAGSAENSWHPDFRSKPALGQRFTAPAMA